MIGSSSRLLLSAALAILMASLPEGIQGRPAVPASQQDARTAGSADPHSAARVRALIEEGHYSEAESVAREHLAEVEALHGVDSLEAAEALDLLVESWCREGKGIEPDLQLWARHAVENKERLLGPDDPGVAVSLDNLGMLLYQVGDLAAGIPPLERSLAIRERAFGADHPDVATSLTYLGVLVSDAGDNERAMQLHRRALAIREKALGPDHPELAWNLSNIAILDAETGDYTRATPLMERALSIRERAYGPDHPLVAGILNNLGIFLERSGDYAGARVAFERAVAIREKALGPNHPVLASTLSNLALLLKDTGDYSEARSLCERALAISEKTRGPMHSDVAWDLNYLASLLRETGDFSSARPLYDRALAIWEKNLGPEHPNVAWGLRALAELLQDMGDNAGARSLYERAIGIWEKAETDLHPDGVPALISLATLTRDAGEPERARALYERAISVWKKAGAPEHPEVAWSLAGMAELLLETGSPAVAFDTALRADGVACKHLRLTSRVLPERVALRYASVRVSSLDLALSIASRGSRERSEWRRRAWDAVIQSRALVLDEMAARRRALAEVNRPGLSSLTEALTSASRRLAGLMVQGPAGLPPEIYRKRLDQARRERERAELALAEKSLLFRRGLARDRLGLTDIAGRLPPDTALLAFALYNDRDWRRPESARTEEMTSAPLGSESSYLAFVLRQGRREPVLVRLGPAGKIEAAFSRWRSGMATGAGPVGSDLNDAERDYRSAALPLRRLIWDPIVPHLAGMKLVLVVPDGVLHLVSLASLPAGETGYLIESGPTIHYLSSERDVVVEPLPPSTGRSLLALGGPEFDNPAPLLPSARPPVGPSGTVAAPIPTDQGKQPDCAAFESIRFEPLPAAAREADEVAFLWRRTAAPGSDARAETLSGPAASEAAFKSMAPDRRVLHLATHAFFLEGGCAPPPGHFRGIGGLKALDEKRPPADFGENPLLLSGLALAGANARTSAEPDGEDGILTAEEIAAMDLSGTEWAVLSACNTGLGEVKAGEGVLGLRRAFQVAGARAVIMSLWDVEDEATREWMRELYLGRLVERLGTAEALRNAGLKMLRTRRTRGESTHPFYWAGFVAAGDWR